MAIIPDVLEPDGNFGHWMRIDRKLEERAALAPGDSATLELESVKDWQERVCHGISDSSGICPSEIKTMESKLRQWRAGMGFAGQCNPEP